MISKDARKCLIALCDRFINSGDDVTLAHLLDALNTAIPDPKSQDRKDWSHYMEELNEVWVRVNKEGEILPWPTVRVRFLVTLPIVTSAHTSLLWTRLNQLVRLHRTVFPLSPLQLKINQACGTVYSELTKKRCYETKYVQSARSSSRVEMV